MFNPRSYRRSKDKYDLDDPRNEHDPVRDEEEREVREELDRKYWENPDKPEREE